MELIPEKKEIGRMTMVASPIRLTNLQYHLFSYVSVMDGYNEDCI